MKQFDISIGTMVLRFYLMVLVIIVSGFTGQWWISIIGGAIFISSLMGFSLGKKH